MQISEMGKTVFVFWLLIPVLVAGSGHAAEQTSGAGKTIKSASDLDYPRFALVRSDGICQECAKKHYPDMNIYDEKI